jgi:hypothetical protein
LFSIRLLLKGNEAALHFTGDCEIALSNLSVVDNIVYNDGQISLLSALSPEPKNPRVDEGSAVHIVLPLLTGVSYRWQENSGNGWIDLSEGNSFAGVNSQELIINEAKIEFNNRRYRCMLHLNDCSEATTESVLQVRVVGIEEPGGDRKTMLTIYPNPVVNDVVTYIISGTPIEQARLRLLDSRGTMVLLTEQLSTPFGSPHTLYVGNLADGLYILQLLSNTTPVKSVKIVRKLE